MSQVNILPIYRIWQLTFIASYLGNLTFPKVQTILFLNTLSQTNNLLPFSRKSVLLYFSTLYNLNIYLWPLKPHNFKSMCRISKIITFLESLRQAGWFESDIQALLIFDPLITYGVILMPLISNCSMMPAWHQLVSMPGHVEESETARKLQLYATSIYQVHSFVCQLD